MNLDHQSLQSPAFSACKLLPLVDPSFSIVICNFNYAPYLGRAVASALAQTPACQVVVVDDGSTDGSRELLLNIDPRVEVVLQANAGQRAAYNAGLERCRGDVVIFLDSDDELLPQAVSSLRQKFDAGIAKVHFRLELMDADGHALGRCIPSTLPSGDMLPALKRHGVLYPSPPASGNAYRVSALQQLFPLPLDVVDPLAADFFTIYGVVAMGCVARCETPLGRYRLHRQSHADPQLAFGNAELNQDLLARVSARYASLRSWIAERTRGAVTYAPRFVDFSVQKSAYAQGILRRPYGQALRNSGKALFQVLESLWLQPEYGLKKQVALSLWAVTLLLAPRNLARRLALRVCNPASRAS